MSIVQKEAIEVIAQSIGITNLSPDVPLSLATDVEYHLREFIQEAIKCMRHSRRTALTADDVDTALNLRNVEPVYGFGSGDALRFKRAAGHMDLYYIDEKDVEFKDVMETPLPRAPLDASVSVHWLAIEGVQPSIPENTPIEVCKLAGFTNGKRSEYKEDNVGVDVKFPVKHILPKELQLYFDKITELTMKRSNSVVFKQALLSLSTDSGLHALVPYFTYFIADEVTRNLNNFSLLFTLMRILRSLLQNPHMHIEPYLHQLIPSVMTCLLAKKLGGRSYDDHWKLRDFAASIVGSICKRFGHVYHNFQPRITRTLLHVFLDPMKSLPQHYGAIRGLANLGPNVVRLLILPNLELYLLLLDPELHLEKQKNEVKRYEARRVHGSLMNAAGLYVSGTLKTVPGLLVPPARAVLKSNTRIVSMLSNKRKASSDNLMQQQPPLKRIATDPTMGIMSMNSMASPGDMMQGEAVARFSGSVSGVGSSGTLASSVHNRQVISNGNDITSSGRAMSKTSGSGGPQAWKENADVGQLIASLVDVFGEGFLSYVPRPETSIFL